MTKRGKFLPKERRQEKQGKRHLGCLYVVDIMISSRMAFCAASARPAPSKPLCNLHSRSQLAGSSSISQAIVLKSYQTLSRPQGAHSRPRVVRVAVMAAAQDKTKVLFVCLGNICRSPTAEVCFDMVLPGSCAQLFSISQCILDVGCLEESCGRRGGSRPGKMPPPATFLVQDIKTSAYFMVG
jgi:hypothetical protein